MTSRRLFLNTWLNSSGFLGNSWNEGSGDRARIFRLNNYIENAKIAHRGVFDAVFFADQPQLTPNPKVRHEYPIDPLILATAILTNVPDIGAIATVSTSFSLPYTLARQLASINLLSEGRIGWNAVTTANPIVAANYGSVRADHAVRYARAEECLDVIQALWRSWKFPWDKATGPVDNPFGEVTPPHFEGKYFQVDGPLNAPLPPWGVPVVAQAGGSPQGKALAAKHGELIYAFLGSKPAGIRFVQEARAAAKANGRPEGAVRVFPSFQPLIGSTEEEVKRLVEQYQSTLAPEEERIRGTAGQLGIDLEKVDIDRPLCAGDFRLPKESAMSVGVLQSMVDVALDEKLSLRSLALRMQLIAGTPEQLANRMIDWWEAGAADGFTINPPLLPDALVTFVDHVTPILQKRGVFPTHYTEPNLRSRYGFPQV